MEIICNPSGIVDVRYPGQGMQDIMGAGFENILLSMVIACSGRELEEAGETQVGEGQRARSRMEAKAREQRDIWKMAVWGNTVNVAEKPWELCNCMRPVAKRYRNTGLHISVIRAPHQDIGTERTDQTSLLSELALESIRFCKETGCRYLIVKPLSLGNNRKEQWEINRKFYMGLADAARENHVMILLENQYRNIKGHLVRGICCDPGETAVWLDALNQEAGGELFGFCMDTVTCSLCGQDMHEFIVSLGSRIKAVTLRECDGYKYGAMLPFTCVPGGQSAMDWLGVIRGLRETGFDGKLILDFGHTVSAFSPFLRPQVVRLAKSVGEYFRWQIEIEALLKKYDSIVLFGAGNMCRNYMHCYGDKYPPLFTCDNHPDLWGREFCGLTVKNPEALKEVPKGCGVFICNIYYREIEAQLREMGIENIEYFNDEYMPAFEAGER